jgi:hypothetical protein
MKRLRREVVRRDGLLCLWRPASRLPSFLGGFSPFVALSEEMSGDCVLLSATLDTFTSSKSIGSEKKDLFVCLLLLLA